MRTLLILLAAVAAAVTLPASASADTPFPSPKVQQVFIAAQTVTPQRALITQIAPGADGAPCAVARQVWIEPR